MSCAWERFGRHRLAQSRWKAAPEMLSGADKAAFEQAWQRQRRMELAIARQAQHKEAPQALRDHVAASLAPLVQEGGFSEQEQQEIIRHHVLLEIEFAAVAGEVPPPDSATVLAWYLRHQARFIRPEQRLARHLLLTVDEGDDRQAIRQKMQQLYQQIAASREAFAALAQRHSHCPSALEGGVLGWIGRGLLYPELEAALFVLAEDGLSQPIASDLGWHLLWCEAIRPAEPMERQQALTLAHDYLWQQSRQQHQRQWLEQMIASQPEQAG